MTDKAVLRTANRISAALDRMIADLPDEVVPQAAMEELLLAMSHPWFMRFLMEDHDFREAYEAAVARIPAKPSRAV
jgi:hypothetical protein